MITKDIWGKVLAAQMTMSTFIHQTVRKIESSMTLSSLQKLILRHSMKHSFKVD